MNQFVFELELKENFNESHFFVNSTNSDTGATQLGTTYSPPGAGASAVAGFLPYEKVSRTFILLILVSMITYSLYNILSYKSTPYYKPIEKTYIVTPITDTVYPLQ